MEYYENEIKELKERIGALETKTSNLKGEIARIAALRDPVGREVEIASIKKQIDLTMDIVAKLANFYEQIIKDKLETETRRRADEHQMFLNKFKLELDLLRYKTNIDKDKITNEMKFYLYKQKKEKERIDLDIQLLILKEQIALSKDLFKFEADVYTMTNKASTDSVTEKIKIMDLLTKGLSLLNLILK